MHGWCTFPALRHSLGVSWTTRVQRAPFCARRRRLPLVQMKAGNAHGDLNVAPATGGVWLVWNRDFRKTCAERSPGDVDAADASLPASDRRHYRPPCTAAAGHRPPWPLLRAARRPATGPLVKSRGACRPRPQRPAPWRRLPALSSAGSTSSTCRCGLGAACTRSARRAIGSGTSTRWRRSSIVRSEPGPTSSPGQRTPTWSS